MYVVCKQARKSGLKSKYTEKRVYKALKVTYPLVCRNIWKEKRVEMYISTSIKSITQKTKSMNTKTFFFIYTKLTHIKHKNKTNIAQSSGTYIFIAYLREMVNQKITKS